MVMWSFVSFHSLTRPPLQYFSLFFPLQLEQSFLCKTKSCCSQLRSEALRWGGNFRFFICWNYSRVFISLILPWGCSKLTKALCSLSAFYSTAVVRGAWLLGLLFETALFPARSSMMSGGSWRRTEILSEMISWTCYVKAGTFLRFFVYDMMLRGVSYHVILPGFEYVRRCIASHLDRVERSIEEISEVPVSRSDCNQFSLTGFPTLCSNSSLFRPGGC